MEPKSVRCPHCEGDLFLEDWYLEVGPRLILVKCSRCEYNKITEVVARPDTAWTKHKKKGGA